jgi:hypothetical protein
MFRDAASHCSNECEPSTIIIALQHGNMVTSEAASFCAGGDRITIPLTARHEICFLKCR